MAPTISTLTDSVNFDEAKTGILAVGVVLAGLYVSIRAVRLVLGFIKR